MKTCGNCDICLEPPEAFDGTETVQKMLSVLARVKHPLSEMAIVGILTGSEAGYIKRAGFDRIRTYGVGKGIPAAVWRLYWQQVIEQQLVKYTQRARGWWLTQAGKQVLLGETKVRLWQSPLMVKGLKAVQRVKKKSGEVNKYDIELFEELRAVRRKLADDQGVPAYIVFSDATLRQMAAKQPKNKVEMLAISGVGAKKWERYGKVFLETIRQHGHV